MYPSRGFADLVLAGVSLLCLISPRAAGQLCGDCDQSGAIGITDALRASQIAVGLLIETPADLAYCDVDSTGSVLVLDALRIAQRAVGLPSSLTCPSAPTPIATSVTLVPPLSGDILIDHVLIDPESDPCSILVEVSLDGGSSFPLLATDAPGGDGRTGLSSSPAGTAHSYAWDSLGDLGPVATSNVVIRISPSDPQPGTPGSSVPSFIDNRPPGSVSWSLDIHQRILDITPGGQGCILCHAGGSPAAGLDLETYFGLMQGSASGAVVVPGDPGGSRIVCKLSGSAGCGQQMPLGGTPWTPTQVDEMRDWITQGALDN